MLLFATQGLRLSPATDRVYGMDDIKHIRNLSAFPKTSASKVVNKLAGRTKYFSEYVPKRTVKYIISSRQRLFHGELN